MSFGASTFGGGVFGAGGGGDASRQSPVTALLSGDLPVIEHLVIPEPYNPATSTRVPLYLGGGWASEPGAKLPTGEALPNQLFREFLDRPPSREVHVLSNGEINLSSVPGYGEIVFTDAYRELIPTWLTYIWEGAPLRAYQGAPYWPLSSFATTFKGEVTALKADSMQATLQIRDLIGRLQGPIETATYAGMGACLKGDGVDDRVSFGDVLDPAGSFSLRFRVFPTSNVNNLSRMFTKDDGATEGGWSAALNNQQLRYFVRTESTTVAETVGNPLQAGRWNDCWVVVDIVAQTVRFVVMTDTSETVASEQFSYTTAPSATTIPLTFGARSDGVFPYAGRWDEMAFFSRALTLDEIKAWRAKRLTATDGLVSLWHCDEATGSTIYDSIGTNHGTIVGAAWDGSLTGTPAVAGKTRIGGAGILPQWEPVLLDEINLVYEVVYGGYHAILQDAAGYLVTDKGSRVYTYAGDYASPYDFNPAAGQFTTSKAAGQMRLGSKPQGKLAVWVQATAATDAGSVITHLSTKAGLQPGEINAGSLIGLTTKNSAPVNIPWGLEQVSADSLIVRAAAAVGAWRTTDLEGLLTVGRLEAPLVPVAELTADDILINGIRPVHTSKPVRAVELRYAEYKTIQGPTELVSSLTERERSDLGQQFRSYRTPENASVIAADDAAPIIVRDTALVYEKDARLEAEREALLRSVPRRTDLVPLFRPRHDLQPGMVIRITLPELDYGSGKLVVIVGKAVDDATEDHALEVWG